MRVRVILGIVIAGCLLSCGRSAQKNGNVSTSKVTSTKDTLIYTLQTIKKRATECGDKPDSSCNAIAKISYLIFKDQTALNDTLTNDLLDTYTPDLKRDASLQQQADNFIMRYEKDTVRDPDDYHLESSANVVRQDSSLVTIQIDRYVRAGTAHGSDYTRFINWNTSTGKKLSLDDLLVDDYRDKFGPIAEKIFHAQDTTILDNNFSMVKGGKLVVTPNFLVTPIGLSFLYNEYDLKPYSEGQTTILIPYVQIKPLLRPNTVISQYLKK